MKLNPKGSIVIYFVLVILSGVLLITGVISYFMVGEIKMARDIGLSGNAYQAADSGMEFALAAKKNPNTNNLNKFETEYGLNSDGSWMCSGNDEDIYWWDIGDCSFCLYFNGPMTEIQSIGQCEKVRRSVQVTY